MDSVQHWVSSSLDPWEGWNGRLQLGSCTRRAKGIAHVPLLESVDMVFGLDGKRPNFETR